jgi:pyruvate kinase
LCAVDSRKHARKADGFPTRAELLGLIQQLKGIRGTMLELESSVDLRQFGSRRASAANLLHYVALRRQDIRGIQDKLELMGISTLGRSESHVLYNIDAVIRILQRLAHEPVVIEPGVEGVSPLEGRKILKANADALFGPNEPGREVRMMATMPSEAATDYALVRDMVAAGMDCMRINCAHDSEPAWLAMVENLRRAEKEAGRRCRVLMDISGPKLRTGKMEPGPQVMRIKPERDAYGRVTKPATVVLSAEGETKPHFDPSAPVLRVEGEWLGWLRSGDVVTLEDSRGSRRAMTITVEKGWMVKAETKKTIYLDRTTRLSLSKEGKRRSTTISNIPHLENPITLRKGDALLVTAAQVAGRPANGKEPSRVSCTFPEALRFVKPGERIWFDDGKIGGVVKAASAEGLRVEVTHVAASGAKLREDKGINLPDTDLRLPPLTPKDIRDLPFIIKHADMVGYSFVRTSEDLRALQSELEKLGKPEMAIIIKVETARAFEQLPTLLLESMRSKVSGVMIARGDLAVECGYERLAEVQEEILWMSEAAHLPTIWATQVLEGLTKSGIPSRAEVTDAAAGQRSECVMLNKGPHLVVALTALNSILRRMQAHQLKKRSMMRRLNIASVFLRSQPSN